MTGYKRRAKLQEPMPMNKTRARLILIVVALAGAAALLYWTNAKPADEDGTVVSDNRDDVRYGIWFR